MRESSSEYNGEAIKQLKSKMTIHGLVFFASKFPAQGVASCGAFATSMGKLRRHQKVNNEPQKLGRTVAAVTRIGGSTRFILVALAHEVSTLTSRLQDFQGHGASPTGELVPKQRSSFAWIGQRANNIIARRYNAFRGFDHEWSVESCG